MEQVQITIPVRRFGETSRKDTWWVQPLVVFLGFSTFIVYSTWAAFQGEYYEHLGYLSPMYSPELFGDSPHAWFGPKPGWWPGFLPFSPAFLILWAPGGFRLTCYYYRGAYYKAFWADPPSCAVGEPRNGFRGENSFPLIIQNLHRYFLYLALLFILVLSYDVWVALWFPIAGSEGVEFGLGVGTLVLALNVVLLGSYTLARIIRKGSDFGSQDGVIVSRTKDRTLPLSSAGHGGRKIGRMARCERPAGQLRRGRSREAR